MLQDIKNPSDRGIPHNRKANNRSTIMNQGRSVAPKQLAGPSSSTLNVVLDALSEIPKLVTGSGILNTESLKRDADGDAETVLWARFDVRGDHINPKSKNELLLLGYVDGFQIWDISNKTDVREVLSLRTGAVVCAKVLQPPPQISEYVDRLSTNRPVLAFCYLSQKQTVQFMELSSAKILNIHLKHDSPVLDITCNAETLIVATENAIFAYKSSTLESIAKIKDIQIVPKDQKGIVINPFALGHRWLAYATSEKPKGEWDDHGGIDPADASSLVDDALGMVQRKGNDLWRYSGQKLQTMSDMMNRPASHPSRVAPVSLGVPESVGLVKIFELGGDGKGGLRKVAHFRAHPSTAFVVKMKFNEEGTLLVTADSTGQYLNVFSLAFLGRKATDISALWKMNTPSAQNSEPIRRTCVPQHLYKLKRGITPTWIRDICISEDSRWVAFTSERETIHVFPMNTRGGAITPRTHGSADLVNNGRFAASSGLTEVFPLTCKTPVLIDGANLKLKLQPDASTSTDDPHILPSAPTGLHGLITSGHATINFCPTETAQQPDFLDGSSARKVMKFPLVVATCHGTLVRHTLIPIVESEEHEENTSQGAPATMERRPSGGDISVLNTVVQLVRTGSPRLVRDKGKRKMETVNLSCHDSKSWDLCRHRDWPDVSRQIQSARIMPPNTRVVMPEGNAEWLSRVEISTYQDGHRKIWMGPQFQFTTTNSINATSDGSPKTEPLPISSPQKDTKGTLSVSFGVAASSWPGSPSIQFPGQSPSTDVVDELSKAMNITPPASPDSDMSEHEATDSETEANIEWCETMFPLEQSTDGDTDWEER
eukprot:m.53265 g.53265  ORF g.53265 m.53265 type:complete len:827 (-) comp10853_c0_seq3:119-2599(-)